MASIVLPHVGAVIYNNFCFTGCPEKLQKAMSFGAATIAQYIVLKYCPYMGQNYGCQISS